MEVDIPYGANTRRITVPAGARVLRSTPLAPLPDARAAFDAAVHAPIESSPLVDLVRPTDRVALVIPDGTRPTPNHLLVPWLIESLDRVPRENFTILVGTGSHRAKTASDLLEMIRQPGFQSPDQWQVQKQALVQQHAPVYLHSSLPEKRVRDALLIPAPYVQETINALLVVNGSHARVAVLPEGPMTVMLVQSSVGVPAT